MARGYSLGAVDYIQLPIDPDVLKAKVAVFVELYRKREEVRQQAELLRQRQEREDARRIELERLRELASEFRESAMLPAKVNDAIRRAQERQTVAALMNLDRELRRMLEEEEAAVVMMLIQDLQ